MWQFVVPLGLLAFALVLATALAGVFRLNLKIHKLLATLAILAIFSHVGLVVYLKYLVH